MSTRLGEAHGQGANTAGKAGGQADLQPGAGEGGPALGLSGGQRMLGAGMVAWPQPATLGWAFSGFSACTPRWSTAPAPFPTLIWDKLSKDTNTSVRARVRHTQRRGQIRPKHHRWHGHLRRRRPSDSVTVSCWLLPPSQYVFLVDFSVCLAFWGCLLSVSYFIIFIVRNRAIFSTLLV